MVSAEALLSYPDWKISFIVHTYVSDKQLGDVIIHNKIFELFSRRLRKPQHNYTTTYKELLMIVECLNQFRGIPIGYEINAFSGHKNLVYAEILGEYQRVVLWQLILKEFGTNIQHIDGVYNIVSDMLS